MKLKTARLALLAPVALALVALPAFAPAPMTAVVHASPANGCGDPAHGFPHPDARADLFGTPIIWNNEDYIWYASRPHSNPDEVRIALSASEAITWWKGIEVLYPGAGVIGRVETQDGNRGWNVMTISLRGRDPRQMAIRILKAKTFGIHTGMYCLDDLSSVRGRTLYFHWARD